jgi:hypothetical protein
MKVHDKNIIGSFVRKTAEGTEEEVEGFIESYKNRYHPYGYMTRVQNRYEKEDGTHVVTMRRARSCS